MLWIENSQDVSHGGGSWGFAKALWSPSRKKGGTAWPWWELLTQVQPGDVVLHLRGKTPRAAAFVGLSVAADSYVIRHDSPPLPGQWSESNRFYYVQLKDFTPFASPVALATLYAEQGENLREYIEFNRSLPKANRSLTFCVIQAGRLQRQNGAYFSEVDEKLEQILSAVLPVGDATTLRSQGRQRQLSFDTGERLTQIWSRARDGAFRDAVRRNYGFRCAFPDCDVGERRLLVSGHIARWADVPSLRGEVSNGICLCLMHDKAFEIGMFTLDSSLQIAINPDGAAESWRASHLEPHRGRRIAIPDNAEEPCIEALKHHWARIGYFPSRGPLVI